MTGWNSDDERAILDCISNWVEKEVCPVAQKYDQADEYPHALVEQMKELGLFGAAISQRSGGLGLSASTCAKIVVKVASACMAPSGIFNTHLIMASAIERSGTEAQEQQWLPKMASGEFRDGNGAKTWITNSGIGHGILLLVKADPAAQPRHKGMSAFIAEKGEGFVVTKKLKKLGHKAIDTCELVFEDYHVSADRLVGGEEGRGVAQIAGGLELGPINLAARGAGERCNMEAAMAKLHGSEAGVFCANGAKRIFGGCSYSVE